MRKIDTLSIHCSDSSWGCAEEIDKWHKERGWRMIGYHYVINNGLQKHKDAYDKKTDGLLEGGRPLDTDIYMESNEVGASVSGHNRHSFGICLIGKDKFTKKQFETLIHVVQYWKSLIPDVKILGHYQFDTAKGKTCPNFNVPNFVEMINKSSLMSDAITSIFKENLK